MAWNWMFWKKCKTEEWSQAQNEAFIKQLYAQIEMLTTERNQCLAKLGTPVVQEDPLETYWNNKRPKSDITYPARPIANKSMNYEVDPRIFWTNDKMPTVTGATHDEMAMNALKYVISHVTYTPDKTQFTLNEEWLFGYETLSLKKGDCEDGAILMANIMLKSGIPYWRIRLNAGNVQGGGHAWVTYLREADNKWYILDWCYWPNESLNFGRTYREAEKYYSIWFSWNIKYIYADEKFERTGVKQTVAQQKPIKKRRKNKSRWPT